MLEMMICLLSAISERDWDSASCSASRAAVTALMIYDAAADDITQKTSTMMKMACNEQMHLCSLETNAEAPPEAPSVLSESAGRDIMVSL